MFFYNEPLLDFNKRYYKKFKIRISTLPVATHEHFSFYINFWSGTKCKLLPDVIMRRLSIAYVMLIYDAPSIKMKVHIHSVPQQRAGIFPSEFNSSLDIFIPSTRMITLIMSKPNDNPDGTLSVVSTILIANNQPNDGNKRRFFMRFQIPDRKV